MNTVLARDTYHTELIDGLEVEKTLPKNLHAFIESFLVGFFRSELPKRYRVMPELNVLCGPDRLVPDVTVAARDARYNDGDLADPASLAVEILSPGQTVPDLFDKCRRITNSGTPLCWVIWPENRNAWVYSREGATEAAEVLSLTLDGREISFTLAEMWAELD